MFGQLLEIDHPGNVGEPGLRWCFFVICGYLNEEHLLLNGTRENCDMFDVEFIWN